MNKYNLEILNYAQQNILKDEERYVIENSKDNKKIIRVKSDRKNIYLGSKYNVSKDILTFKSTIKNIDSKSIFLIWGFGTGEHISDLLENISNSNRIIVIEPDEKILIENVLTNNIKKLLEDTRVVVLNYKKGSFTNFLSENITETEINNIDILIYTNYDKIYNKEFKSFSEEFIEFVTHSIISINTSLHFSKQFFKCFVRNIKTMVNSTLINELRNKFINMPAIVVSAGPSLEKNVDLLKAVQDKFIIITGGRTLNTLLDKGIKPDFVCSIDPGDASYDVIEKALHSDVPLVFSEVSNERLVKEYAGGKVFFKDIDFFDITDDFLGVQVDWLDQGGSVAHSCISLATYLGCNVIIMIGQDLAYTNNKYHAESANIEKSNDINLTDNYIYVEGVNEKKVPTTKVLDLYRKKIEDMTVKYSSTTTFVNSTEGGAHINGTLVKSLKESIKKYSYSRPIDKNIDNILNGEKKIDKKFVVKKIEFILKSIKNIEKICKEALDYTNKMYMYYDKNILVDINFILTQLDRLDDKLNKELQNVISIKKLYAPLVSKIMISDKFKNNESENEKQKGKRISLKSKTLYKGLIEIVREAKMEFEEAKKEI